MDSQEPMQPVQEAGPAGPEPVVAEPSGRKEPFTRIPLFIKILYIWAGISLVLYILFRIFPSFADFFNTHISAYLRIFLAKLTVWIPFSLAEIILLSLPVVFVVICILSSKIKSDSWHTMWIYIADLCSILAVLFSVFVWNLAAGYYGPTVDKRLGIDAENVTVEELYETTCLLAEKVNDLSQEVEYSDTGSSVKPWDWDGMNRALTDAYNKYYDEIDSGLYLRFSSHVKRVMISRAMSYTYITGVYTYFTGEANINVDFPDYTIPYTAAHELAHQRGFARENEANFVAYLICHNSDDAYVRYSGEISMFEYLYGILCTVDEELAHNVLETLDENVLNEFSAYNDFLETRQNKVVQKISLTFNDTYLKSQGTDGSISYDLVAYLAVAYYRNSLG